MRSSCILSGNPGACICYFCSLRYRNQASALLDNRIGVHKQKEQNKIYIYTHKINKLVIYVFIFVIYCYACSVGMWWALLIPSFNICTFYAVIYIDFPALSR